MKFTFKRAFTLAEVLITLAVIGVVAVLAIGIFMPKIQEKVLAMQAKTAMIKFTKATEQMALNNKIGPFYQDTEEFVGELGKYLKLAKVCKNDKLSDCFGYETLTLADGDTYNLSDLKDGKGFNFPANKTRDFTGDTVGFVTVDGIPTVLAWDKRCEILEPGVYEWSNNTNASTKCVAALMDVNGTKRPDKLGRDVILLNASSIGACIKFTTGGKTYKWGCLFTPEPISRSECLELKNSGKIRYCAAENATALISYDITRPLWTYFGGDRWASAVRTCGGTDKMPTPADIAAFTTYVYGLSYNLGSSSNYYCSNNSACLNTARVTGSGLNSIDHLHLWTNSETNGTYAAYRYFDNNKTTYFTNDRARFESIVTAVCKL